jgi:hypothetical protein
MNIIIKGFVDITVFNEDGTVKQHQYKENTLTHAALASMFCDFLFRGDSWNGGNTGSDSYSSSYLAYLERENTTGKTETSPRDLILRGTDGVNPTSPVFSHRTPASLGMYCLNTFIQNENYREPGVFKFDQWTQVAPYTLPDGTTMSPYVVFYNAGGNASSFYPTDENDTQFIRSMVDCSFNLSDLSFTIALRKSIGSGTIKSVVWGIDSPNSNTTASYFWQRMFDVRSRILSKTNFNFGGYSPFYATEQRLINTGGTDIPHTILWQDTARPDGTRYSSGLRQIFGYDLTVPGANDTNSNSNLGVEVVDTSNWQYMARFMQGVIIGENAFGLDYDTSSNDTPSLFFTPNSGTIKVNVYKVANWKTSSASTSLEISFTDNGYSGILDGSNRGCTKPVLVHNLVSGNLEVFITTSFDNTAKKYRVGRAVIDPVAFNNPVISYYTSDFCISNYRLSMPGTDTNPTSAAYPRARSVSGFLDYNTGEYYLPYIAYCDSNGAVRYLPGGHEHDRGQWLRLGIQCSLAGSAVIPSRLYVQGYACSGRGNPSDNLGSEYSYSSTRGLYGYYRYLLWAYAAPISTSEESPVQHPLQFIPLTGNAVSSGSLTMVSPSQVMCGLDLDTPVTKASSEVLFLKYGWKISQKIPETT